MGMIINIDRALKERSNYNVLQEPLHKMMQDEQEAWERENPIDLLFVRSTISGFQETYTSSIGFAHAFAETADYAVGPIFNQAEGFTSTYRTKTFQGGFIISQQTLEDGQVGKIKDDASAFGRRWRADIVEYAMKSLEGAFGKETTWGDASTGGVTYIKLDSADTVDGKIRNPVKNPLFTNAHKTVDREDSATSAANVKTQSNLYYADIDLSGDASNKVSSLADVINQVITNMENYYDDNGKITGVLGAKTIVIPNDAHLKAALNTAISMDMFDFGESKYLNPAYKRATVHATPYLNDICKGTDGKSKCIFIVDKSYNQANHGLEFTERIPFTLNAFEKREAPQGIKYEGRQRFDTNVSTWRGIACIYLGNPADDGATWANSASMFTPIAVGSPIATPVKVVNASEIGA